MKTSVAALLVVAAYGVAAHAQPAPADHAAHQSQAQSADSPDTAAEGASRMRAMQALMDRIRASKTEAERERLLEEHRKLMQDQMQAMKGMECRMDRPDAPTPGGMGGGMMNGQMMCQRMMQGRMQMMMGMMDQMMQREEARHGRH